MPRRFDKRSLTWLVHNVVAHPLYEILLWFKLERAANWIHEKTTPVNVISAIPAIEPRDFSSEIAELKKLYGQLNSRVASFARSADLEYDRAHNFEESVWKAFEANDENLKSVGRSLKESQESFNALLSRESTTA